MQSILDHLRYEELTSKPNATGKDLEEITKKSKSNRWKKTKKEIGLDD